MPITTTNPDSRPIVTSETSTNTGVSVAIDYTTYYSRIATALETIALNTTTIKNSLDNTVTPAVASFTGNISDITLNVSGVSGTITTGMRLIGGAILPNTFIVSGSGNTWTVSKSQSLSSTSLTGILYNGYITDLISNISSKQTTIADKQTTIADKQTTIADKQTTIADKQTQMETYQKKLKELGEANGIHIVGAYDAFGMVSLYRLLIEQAKILDNTSGSATPAQIQASIAEVERVVGLIRDNIPKEF